MIKRKFLILSILPVIIVFSIWIPFGFALTGTLEEWGILGIYNTYGLIFVADISGPWASLVLRPLTMLPQSIAYLLDPNSFKYWHVLLMLALIIKGVASSHLVWKATNSLWWGVVMGMLVLVYPADTMQLSFRGIHINWALALILLASSIFIVAYEHKRPFIKYSLGILAAALLTISISIYEATLLLTPMPLLVLFVRYGLQTFFEQLRTRIILAAIWLSGAGLYVAYAIDTAPKIASYQASLGGSNTLATLLAALPKLFTIGAFRSLFGGWYDAAAIVGSEFSNYAYLVFAIVFVGLIVFFISKNLNKGELEDSKIFKSAAFMPSRLALVGFALMLAGYAPYLLSPSHMAISQRTFLCATIGAAMFWVAMLILASRASKIFAKIIVMCLIFIGLGAQLFQFHHYSNISDTQRQLLKNIVENFDGNLSDKTLLILDESNQLNHIWMFLTENLYGAMAYMYGHPISAIEVCYMPSQEWQFADDLGRKGRCESSANDWSFHPPEAVSGPGYVTKSVQLNKIINKDKIISITIKPNGSVDLNPKLDQYRKNLIHDDSSLAMRYRGVLATQPWVLQPVMFKDQLPSNSYRWDFGNWWSLEIPIRGSGWREAEWEVGYFKHKSSAWKTQKKAVLNFDLLPKNGKYILRGKFDMILNPTIKQSVKVNLNKKNINYQWISNGLFEAEIESNLLQSGINEIEFESEIDSKYYGLSIKLDWFELKPKNY